MRSTNSKKIKPTCNFFLNVIFKKKIITIESSSQRHLTVLAGWAQSSHKLVNAITESPKRWRLTFFLKKKIKSNY